MDKSMELQKSLLNEVATILDNEELTEKALHYVRRLKAKMNREEKKEEEEAPLQYTVEELKESLNRSEADFAAGRFRPSSEVFREIERELTWLK